MAAEIKESLQKLHRVASAECEKLEPERAVDILQHLKNLKVTRKVLIDTGAGKTLKQYSKHGHEAIRAAAKQVVDLWKQQVLPQENATEQSKPSRTSQATNDSQNGASGLAASSEQNAKQSANTPNNCTRDSQGDDGAQQETKSNNTPVKKENILPPATGNQQRDKFRKLLYDALLLSSSAVPDACPGSIAADIEQALFVKQNETLSTAYKSQFKSMWFNLKDANNPDLRTNVLTGSITADRLAVMKSAEMASAAKQAERQRIEQQMMEENTRGVKQNLQTTDQFKLCESTNSLQASPTQARQSVSVPKRN